MPIGREDGDIVMSDGEKVDISKIKPGDKVTLVPLEVDSLEAEGVWLGDGLKLLWVPIEDIAECHPAARELGVTV